MTNMSNWHYTKDGQAVGPIPFESLRQLTASGELPDGTLVWTQGMPNWLPPSEVPGLANPNAPAPEDVTTATHRSENPYAAPSSAANLAVNPSTNDLDDIAPGSEPLRIDMLISKSWDIFKNNIGVIFAVGIIYIVISIVASQIFSTIFPGSGDAIDIGLGDQFALQQQESIIAQILDGILSLFLGLGAIRIGLNLLKGHDASISDLFSQGRLLIRSIFASILVYILAALVAIPGGAIIFVSFTMGGGGNPNIAIAVIGVLLALIPAVFVAVRLSFAQHCLVDRDRATIDALSDSWTLTKDNAMRVILLYIVQGLLVVAGLLALVVGLLIALPLVYLSSVAAYLFLRHGWRAAAIN